MKDLSKEFIQLDKELDKIYKKYEKDINKNYAKASINIKREIAQLYERYGIEDGQIDFNELLKYNRLEKLKSDVGKTLIEVYKTNTNVTRQLLRDIIKTSYKETLGFYNSTTGKRIKAIQKHHDVTKTLNARVAGYNWIERTGFDRASTIQRVEKKIVEGLDTGLSYHEVATNLTDDLNISMNKANMIARTETHRARNQSKIEALQDINNKGGKIKKKWLSMADERVREGHDSLDGTIIDIDEEFESPLGGRGLAPGQMNNAADNVNCRCVMVMVIE